MSSERVAVSNKPGRLPKKGTFFGCARIAGWLSIISGLLLLGIAIVGFIAMLIKMGPTLLESAQYMGQQQFAGFTFLLSLGYLAIFPVIGLVGLVMAGIGFVLVRVGTEPAAATAIPGMTQMGQIKEPPKEGAG